VYGTSFFSNLQMRPSSPKMQDVTFLPVLILPGKENPTEFAASVGQFNSQMQVSSNSMCF